MPKTVTTSEHYRLLPDEDNLIMTGPDGQQGYGNELNNRIDGSIHNNLINGMQGADIMAGHGGNDTYMVDNIGDLVIESANEGYDQVFSTVNYTLPNNVEALVLMDAPNSYPSGSGPLIGNGNNLDNKIWGNIEANTLHGNGGNDVITANAGNDKVYGDAGNDILLGQAGLDELHGGTGNDSINGGADKDVLWGDAGCDSFVFFAVDGVSGKNDTVQDFNSCDDTLDFYGFGTASHGAKLVQVGNTDDYKIIAGTDHVAGIADGQIVTVHGQDVQHADYIFH